MDIKKYNDPNNKISDKTMQGIAKGFGQEPQDHFSHLSKLKGDVGDVLSVHSTIKDLNKGGMSRDDIKNHMMNSKGLKQYANNYAKSEGWDVSKDKDFYNRFTDDTLRDAFIENGKNVYINPNINKFLNAQTGGNITPKDMIQDFASTHTREETQNWLNDEEAQNAYADLIQELGISNWKDFVNELLNSFNFEK